MLHKERIQFPPMLTTRSPIDGASAWIALRKKHTTLTFTHHMNRESQYPLHIYPPFISLYFSNSTVRSKLKSLVPSGFFSILFSIFFSRSQSFLPFIPPYVQPMLLICLNTLLNFSVPALIFLGVLLATLLTYLFPDS